MIIDFHTHTFPDALAPRAIAKLSSSAHLTSVLDGTAHTLSQSTKEAGIDLSIVLPVATKPSQTKDINKEALLFLESVHETKLLSFGAIHPDNEDYRNIIKELACHNIPGIKLHPVFQQTYFDDIRYLRIIDCACEHDLIVVTHAGYDISSPHADYVTSAHILPVIRQLAPAKLVLAHMGGWDCYEEVYEHLCGQAVYFDTSFSLDTGLSIDFFTKIVKKHGAQNILFGTDSPWSSQKETLEKIKQSGLSEKEIRLILSENAAGLLNRFSHYVCC